LKNSFFIKNKNIYKLGFKNVKNKSWMSARYNGPNQDKFIAMPPGTYHEIVLGEDLINSACAMVQKNFPPIRIVAPSVSQGNSQYLGQSYDTKYLRIRNTANPVMGQWSGGYSDLYVEPKRIITVEYNKRGKSIDFKDNTNYNNPETLGSVKLPEANIIKGSAEYDRIIELLAKNLFSFCESQIKRYYGEDNVQFRNM